MGTLKEEMELMVAVGVWAATADGKIERAETEKILTHLMNFTEEEVDPDAVTEEVTHWISEFNDDYDHAQMTLKGRIEGCRNISVINDDLIDIAQRIIVADEDLAEQEDALMEILQSWLP